MLLTTPQFGEVWMQNPFEKKIVLSVPNMSSPSIYASTVKDKLDIHPVEIINNEVICAGTFR